MRQSEEVRAFKTDLASYNVKKREIARLEEQIENCYEQLGGVRGIDPSKEPTHAMPNKDVEYAIRDKIERIRTKKDRLCDQINYLDEILDKIETALKTAVIEVYANGRKIRSLAAEMYLSETGLRKRMNKAIEKALID